MMLCYCAVQDFSLDFDAFVKMDEVIRSKCCQGLIELACQCVKVSTSCAASENCNVINRS